MQLFEGKTQYTRYATQFTKLVNNLDKQLKRHGFEVGDLGSHFCCKWVAKMVAALCTFTPPIVALCIWAGWGLGGVKKKPF